MTADFEIVELGQPFGPGVLHMPAHPPFTYELTALHREEAEDGEVPGSSSAVDRISTGLHVGTHIDSLSHVGLNGCLCDGTEVLASGVQSAGTGVSMRSGAGLRPIVAAGILLDFPSYFSCEVLDDGYEISPDDLLGCAASSGVEIEAGSVVLIRTGFDRYWDDDPERFLTAPAPGPGIEAARLLRERGIVATGSDTAPYERHPYTLAVHVELIAEGGIFIIECMRLQELATHESRRFQFITLPLQMGYATGSPINPVAILTA